MQELRRVETVSNRRSAVVSRGAARLGDAFRSAEVTTLGDYITRHGRGMREGGIPGARTVADGQGLRPSLSAPKQNRLLAALGAADYARLLPQLELVSLPRGKVLCEGSRKSDFVYFPTNGIVSLCHELENGATVEVAVTGNDGMVGIAAFMGGGATTNRELVRNAGYGYRMLASRLKAEFDSNPAFRQVLMRYAQALIAQLTHSAVCQGHHRLEQQFCRLLLVSMDLLRSNDIALTQDAVAGLLGARRESITAVAGKLQSAGLIRYHRGRITVVDRAGLATDACECYAAAKSEVDRAIPQSPPRRALLR